MQRVWTNIKSKYSILIPNMNQIIHKKEAISQEIASFYQICIK